ncbi:hypothetical protein [Azospirillum rugosum]|uniref:DUF4089 domain-containing protein n=1 Tax=Azospirillum rugosum TaxID=416170 RepID=A0ABS4SWU5_9PROT|nr:hypothetical protein [Azospirillum rugosum]MBP2297035.1 hypothetical protein [Azospirillum rugosum]MDQ0530829.1 hypothetical protein [Azospirillum rugosum]
MEFKPTAEQRVQATLACLDLIAVELGAICTENRLAPAHIDLLLERLASMADLIDAALPAPDNPPGAYQPWLH